MARVEELPHGFDDKVDLSSDAYQQSGPPQSAAGFPLDDLLAQRDVDTEEQNDTPMPSQPGAAMPPGLQKAKQTTTDELLAEMNRVPLFMTALDESNGAGGENVELEAMKALAYEGTRAEIAGNFRQQGNDMAKEKRWFDAREFYTKALAALKAPLKPQDAEEGPADYDVAEVDEQAEIKKERKIEEACYSNRALCNFEMKNYGSCNRDCASALRLDDANVKAWYRAASACLALDNTEEAFDACNRGLEVDISNKALNDLSVKIIKRSEELQELQQAREDREERKRKEAAALKMALKTRNIPTRTTPSPLEMEDAAIALADPLDPASTLSFPVILLYPLQAQSDFVKACQESESIGEHLTYIFPLPWDEKKEYTPENVECYMETTQGGLIKAGKKMSLLRVLSSGKVEVVDGLVKVNVLPKSKAKDWIEEVKSRRPK